MTSSLDPVRRALSIFLNGGEYAPFWIAVKDVGTTTDTDPDITDDEREWYDELYDAVYMADEDPIDEGRAEAVMIGAAELRVQLRAMRLDQF